MSWRVIIQLWRYANKCIEIADHESALKTIAVVSRFWL
jgi:hypothetical protein